MRAWIAVAVAGTSAVGAVGAVGFVGCASVECSNDPTCVVGATNRGDASADASTPDGSDVGSADALGDDTAASTDAGVADGPGCNRSSTPKDTLCVLTDDQGIFVSPTGVSGGAGTQGAPTNTVTSGLALAEAAGVAKRIYVCAGTYAESLTLDHLANGIQIYGGLSCPGAGADAGAWGYTGTKAVIAPPTGVPLTLQSVTGATFEDMEFDGPSAPQTQPTVPGAAGASSIGVFVSGSTGVKFQGCAITAGAGQPGQDQTPLMAITPNAPDGDPGQMLRGGAETPNPVCMTSVGGLGGGPTMNGQDGTDGAPGGSNAGTKGSDCKAGTGGDGASGAGGSAGQGAQGWATFSTSGWAPSGGSVGGTGDVGQGGGGGASRDTSGGAGGGGAGGCGGSGGSSGTGGGSSVAVLQYQSVVDLEQCMLTAGNAGRGGNGATGQVGQAPGNGGTQFSDECAGGKGGFGGGGGGGGGGAGGLSAGVVWSGTAPMIAMATVSTSSTLSTVTLGMPGAAGQPGSGGVAALVGSANAGTDGVNNAKAGVAGAVVQFQ